MVENFGMIIDILLFVSSVMGGVKRSKIARRQNALRASGQARISKALQVFGLYLFNLLI